MNPFAKTFHLTACALAASVLISACGGGAATDTTPPTVAITSAAETGGSVKFTFTFSEDVGTSFAVEDVAVTGGAPGTLARVDATHYTLVVTPTTGVISATVATAKFLDIANNPNTALAANTYSPVAMDFSATNISFNPFEGLVSVAIADDPVLGASNKVVKFVKGPAGQPWAGATIYTAGTISADPAVHSQLSVDAVDLSGSKLVTMRSYTAAPIGTVITLKFENAANPGANIAAEAKTTTQSAWETLTFDFSKLSTGVYSASTVYNTLSIFPAFSIPASGSVAPAADTTFYFDDLNYTKAAGGTTPTPVATEPTTAAATPTALAANVLSIYSDAYTPVAGVVTRPDWGQSTAVSEVTIAGNKTEKYTAFNYEGITFTPIDVTSMTKLHIDVWTPDLTALDVFVLAGGAEQSVKLTPTLAGWNSFDINLSDYTTLNKAGVKEMKLVSTGGSTLYFDNLYFWKPAAGGGTVDCGTTEPTCAPTTVIPADAVTIYSEASATALFNAFPSWGQATLYSEATLAGNKSLKYTNLNYEGMEFTAVDVSAKGKVHFDFWSPELTSVKVSIISPGKENAVTQVLTTKGWNSADIDLSQYNVPDLKGINQIKLEATGSGTLYVDNIYFWGTAAAVVPGSTPNPTALPGSAGPVTLPLLTSTYLGDFGAAGNGVFAADYVGGVDTNGNHATWPTAVTKGLASNGNIGYYQSVSLSTSAQKLEENGWVAGLTDNAGGVPSLFRFFILTPPATTFANTAYMGLFVNAPNNGTVDVSSFGSIKLRLWGPAEMYQDPSFSPTLVMALQGAKVAGCTTTDSGATEIDKSFTANQKIGAASTYSLSLAAGGWTVKGVCGADTPATAVASVLSKLATVAVTVPGTSFNFTHANVKTVATDPTTYATGLNLGPIIFTAN